MQGKSGLFSLLPAPKNAVTKITNRPLIPDSLSRKTASRPGVKPTKKPGSSVTKQTKLDKKLVADTDDVSDDDDGEHISFFSLGESSSKSLSPNEPSETISVAPKTDITPQTAITAPSVASKTVTPVLEPLPQTDKAEDKRHPNRPMVDMDAPLHFGRTNYQPLLSYKPQSTASDIPLPETSEKNEEAKPYAYPQVNTELS